MSVTPETTLLAPAYGEDGYEYLEPVVAALNGSRSIPLGSDGAIEIAGDLSVADDLSVTGDASVDGGLTVLGASVVADVTAAAVTATTLSTSGDVTVGDDLIVTDALSAADASFSGTLTAGASTLVGNLTVRNSAPTIAFFVDVTAGAQFVRVGTSGSPLVYADIQNTKVIIGSGTDPAITGERLVVLAGPAVMGHDNDQSLYFKRTSGSGSASIGTSSGSSPDLVFKDNGGNQTARILNGAAMIVGTSTALVGSEKLLVDGDAVLSILTLTGSGNVFILNGSSQTQTTVGAAGGASALPATPLGYIKSTIGGTDVAIPYYRRS